VKSIRRLVVILVAPALGGVSSGCSFVFMDTVPTDHAKLPYFDCTSTYGLAVADGFFALSSGIGVGMTLSQSKQEYADKNSGANRNVAAAADIIAGGVTVASGVYGVVQAMRCDRAKEELKARIFAAPLRPPPPIFVPQVAPAAPPPVPEAPPPPEVVPAPPPPASPPAPPPSGWVPIAPGQ
jgi:hypothetical protein